MQSLFVFLMLDCMTLSKMNRMKRSTEPLNENCEGFVVI